MGVECRHYDVEWVEFDTFETTPPRAYGECNDCGDKVTALISPIVTLSDEDAIGRVWGDAATVE